MFEYILTYTTIFLVVVLFLARVCRRPSEQERTVTATIDIPNINAGGITVAMGHLWLIDSNDSKLYKIDMDEQKVISALDTELTSPRGLTWDGNYFWCTDNSGGMVHRVDWADGKSLNAFDIPVYDKTEPVEMEDVAWDETNECLWVAYAAGDESEILRMNCKTGEVIQAVYANCHPRGLAVDGDYLWVASYNRNQYGGAVSRQIIMDDADQMSASKVYLRSAPGKTPAGITFDEKALWVVDRALESLVRVLVPASCRL